MRIDMRSSKTWIPLIAIVLVVQLLTLTPLWGGLQQHTPTFVTSILHRPVPTAGTELTVLPSAYTALSTAEQLCEDSFGTSYLTKLATNQLSYCESPSSSRLQCFRRDRFDFLWDSDSLCIAQGVEYNKSHEHEFGLQCQLRNFTSEVLSGKEDAVGIQDISKMHSYWFNTGVRDTLYPWKIQKDGISTCDKESADKSWILLARRESNVNIFHKLAELWQATMTMDVVRMATDPSGQPYLTREQDLSVQVAFDDDRQEPLDEWWTVVTGREPTRKSKLEAGCYGNVIIPLPGSSNPFWMLLFQDAATPDQICATKTLINTFRQRLFHYLRIEPRLHTIRPPVITIIDRKSTRKIFKLGEYVFNLRLKYPGLKINLVDFATISLREQVVMIQDTDILIGHHGAGMAHVMFLPEQSSVIEIFSPVFKKAGFSQLSKMRGLTHFSANSLWVGDWQRETNTSILVDPPPFDPETWQTQEWAYIREKDFQAYVDAALKSQSYKID